MLSHERRRGKKGARAKAFAQEGRYIHGMAEYTLLTFEVADRIATITINRPDKLNALNDATIAELGVAIDEARMRADVGGVILTGAGRAFVAGADISELAGQTPFVAKGRARAGQEVFRRYETCPKPVIAAVNGFALGGGCELAMACHIRIASEHAKFGQPEVKLGILPGFGGTQRLPRLIGKGRALQLLTTGETIDAEEAHRIGLVNRVVHAAELLGSAQMMLKQIMANGPLAVALCIEAVDRGLEMSLDEGLTLEVNHFGLLASTDDMREGMGAFLEKRAPQFKGR
jgi:enoyl-CoA hydratase